MKCPEVNEKLLQLDTVWTELDKLAGDFEDAEKVIDDNPQMTVSYHPLTGR